MDTCKPPTGVEDWRVLRRFIPLGWRDQARACGALRRARGVRSAEMLLRILLLHLAGGCSLAETAARAEQAGWGHFSAVALFKRLQRAEEWLRWLAEQTWRARPRPPVDGARRVRAVDATLVQESGPSGSRWRVHFSLDLRHLQCDHFALSDHHVGETFRRIPVQAGDLLLGDRAYATPPGVAHVVGQQADVLVRINLTRLPLFHRNGRRLSILARLRSLRRGAVGDWPAVVQTAAGPVPGRLIAVRRGRIAARQAERRLRRKARHQQKTLSAQALEGSRYVFVWTTLPAPGHPPAAVLELYRLRWQIELAFKRLKSILGLGQLPKHNDASARAWLHGKLFVAMLLERLHAAADAFSPWGYPLEKAAQPLARAALPRP